MIENGVLMQSFHWHTPADGSLWNELAARAEELARRGITGIWLPPAYKGAGGARDEGYAVYDLYDLGEFDQKGSVRTKYGSKDELLRAIAALKAQRIRVYADVVFNHRCGGDATEEVDARKVDLANRNQISDEVIRVKAWTRFDFPGRGERYSAMKWNKKHFIAVDVNADAPDQPSIYLFEGKTFSGDVSFEQGNFDYLMGCDVDVYDEEVRAELLAFGRWLLDTTGVDGFRLDALKHIAASFFKEWLSTLRAEYQRELFTVGEYWTGDIEELLAYLAQLEGTVELFDVPLHFRMFEASRAGREFDLRTFFDGTLVQAQPLLAVTFVDNHDSQPGSALGSFVDPWFKPLAYALILLRREGYPCIFYPDYYGHALGEEGELASHKLLLDVFLDVRARYNYGDQHDYFDHPTCVAWLRTGNQEHPGAMVVVLSSGDAGQKRIETGKPGATFRDRTGHDPDPVHTDEAGSAEFRCPPGSLSVWVQD